MANTYLLGQQIRLSAAYKNSAGAAADPTTVTFKIKSPAGTTTTLVYGTDAAAVKDSTGNYHVDRTPDAAGEWSYKFIGAGTIITVGEGWLVIDAGRVG